MKLIRSTRLLIVTSGAALILASCGSTSDERQAILDICPQVYSDTLSELAIRSSEELSARAEYEKARSMGVEDACDCAARLVVSAESTAREQGFSEPWDYSDASSVYAVAEGGLEGCIENAQ